MPSDYISLNVRCEDYFAVSYILGHKIV